MPARAGATKLAQIPPATLLFVDDEPDIVDALRRLFRRRHRVLTATSGREGIEIIRKEPVDLIICDQRMPDVTGDRVLATARTVRPEAIRILLTGYSDIEALINCVNDAGLYKYLTKPWEPEMLRLTVERALEALNLQRLLATTTGELEEAYRNAVTMLSIACEGKDEDTGNHVQRVQHYTAAMAMDLGIAEEQAQHMGVMSILHDVGKMSVPDAILKKPGKLTPEEWEIMKTHTTEGVRILGDHPFYEVAREIAGGHHENWDGSGYPGGLKGEAIPLCARIVKVADVFDALASRRPYKDPWPIPKILAYFEELKGRQFDPRVIESFMRLHENGVIARIIEEYPPSL
ncbi:MAG: HD domain-containing protein [Alphaproteobacteria bacterium]|nr:MAG: HD domain-containing protein [Alphaproteobacteria bacterium]